MNKKSKKGDEERSMNGVKRFKRVGGRIKNDIWRLHSCLGEQSVKRQKNKESK